MQKILLYEQSEECARLAVLEDGQLVELYEQREAGDSLIGNLYIGRALNVLPGMQAAFVDIGLDKNGFLSLDDLAVPDMGDALAALPSKPRPTLRPGQELMVQVHKQPGGDKGPRLTCNITLPGRVLVLLPTLPYVGISRKIEREQERARLRDLAQRLCPEGMGLIIRTAADGADEQLIEREIRSLLEQWQEVSALARYRKAPSLLKARDDLLSRAVRDMLQPDVNALIVEGESFARAIELAALNQGKLRSRIVRHDSDVPLFALYRVEAQAQKALDRKVWLGSGGYLIFDYTEAMTVIDVNTGKFTGKASLAQTIEQTNREAAVEIARQLRLRDIGGIVIVDFIDMDEEAQREGLLDCFVAELKKDRTKTNLLGMTRLGLVEMTRKKLGASMLGARAVCPKCHGSGRVERGKGTK